MAGFLSMAGARVIDALLAAIAADFATSIETVSVIVAAFTLGYGIAQLPLGAAGARFGKVRLIVAALLFYALFTGLCAVASGVVPLAALRVCAGAASAGLIPTCLAYLGDVVRYEDRQVAISRFLYGIVLAQLVAGPLGGLFGDTLGWRLVFIVLAALALGLAALIAAHKAFRAPPVVEAALGAARYRGLVTAKRARMLLALTFAEGVALMGGVPFLAPYLHGGFGLSYRGAGLVVACFGVGAMLYTWRAKRLLALLGESGLALCGGVLAACGYAAGMAVPSWPGFLAVEVAIGAGYFMLHSVMQVRATELLPQARSVAVSGFVFMLFLGQSAGALAMGWMIGNYGYAAAFLVEAALLFMLTFAIARYLRAVVPPEEAGAALAPAGLLR